MANRTADYKSSCRMKSFAALKQPQVLVAASCVSTLHLISFSWQTELGADEKMTSEQLDKRHLGKSRLLDEI